MKDTLSFFLQYFWSSEVKACSFQVFQYSKAYKDRRFLNTFFFSLNKGLFKLVKGEVGFRNPKQQIAGPGSQDVFSYGCVPLNQVSPHASYCMLLFLFLLVLFVCLPSPNQMFLAVGTVFHCVQVRCLRDFPHFFKAQ